MNYKEASDFVEKAIEAMEFKQAEIGNAQYRFAYITGALMVKIKFAIADNDLTGLIEFLNNQINTPE